MENIAAIQLVRILQYSLTNIQRRCTASIYASMLSF